jgi:hypothetical protein
VEPEDVVHVLSNMVRAVRPGGTVLDLQVIRPNPVVESDAGVLCEVDGESLLRKADAAARAVGSLVGAGRLVEEALDDHDVRTHYRTGSDLVEDFAGDNRRLPDEALAALNTLVHPCLVRERCRLRRLRVGA